VSTVTTTQLIDLLSKVGLTDAQARDDSRNAGMIYTVFNDGEVCCQKAGSLLWQRSLHCFRNGGEKVSEDGFPGRMNGFAYVHVAKREDAYAISNLILGRPEGDEL
jgi:hypothetical protein